MKYIKIYEAFESRVISNTIKFLSKKIGETETFYNDIRKLMNQYDINISKIKEEHLEYLRTSKAIEVKSDEFDNDLNIYCIKYWFSIEKGFLGRTATGSLKTPYSKIKYNYLEKNRNFDSDQFLFIKNELGIEKGKLSSVLDYEYLKTGDDVLVILGRESKVTIGKIFIDSDDGYGRSIFIYNNDTSDGITIHSNEPIFLKKYSKRWRLGSNFNKIDDDHHQLHTYTMDNKELRFVENENEHDHKANLADFNKPLDVSGNIVDWTINNQDIIEDVIKKSDFAIIVYIDKLLSISSRNFIQKNRIDLKKGATALMSDKEIKEINIQKYTNKLISIYGLSVDSEDFSKINKFINTIMGNKFIMFNLYLEQYKRLDFFINDLYDLVNVNRNKDYYFDRVINRFRDIRNESTITKRLYTNNLNIILNSGNENLIVFTKRLLDLGEKINKYIESNNIENIHDIISIKYKLETISKFITESRYKIPESYYNVIYVIDESERIFDKYVKQCNSEEEFKETMMKLNIIEKFVNSLLK
jgi:hypothetical protein